MKLKRAPAVQEKIQKCLCVFVCVCGGESDIMFSTRAS